MIKPLTYKPFGPKSVLIEWPAEISSETLQEISILKQKLQGVFSSQYQDMIVGYHSLTIVFKDSPLSFKNIISQIEAAYKSKSQIKKERNFLWKIPVCYDVSFGIDLEKIANEKNLTIKEIITKHTKVPYLVYFIGFLPGFLYLGGLNESLFVQRKSSPRLQIAKGSVAIGGKQTGVYPSDSAGGWNIIGRTPISFFNPTLENPCFAKSGDKIQFYAISLDCFYEIENKCSQGEYFISKDSIDD